MRCLVVGLSVVALLAPCSLARAEPTTPPTPQTSNTSVEVEEAQYPPSSTRWSLLLGGVGFTAAWYGAAVGASYAFPDLAGMDDLRIPIVGPWLSLAHTGCGPTNPGCNTGWVVAQAILTVLDGIGQASGPLFILESIMLPSRETTPGATRPAPLRHAPPANSPGNPSDGKNLYFLPRPTIMGLGGVGLQVWGRF